MLLELAWSCEPTLNLRDRCAALDRLEQLLTGEPALPAPPGRDWALELTAERAIDAAANVRLPEALDLATGVLANADPSYRIAIARATLARARAWAWEGTEESRRRGDQGLAEAAELFRRLGHSEWEGFSVFWRGYSVHFETGHIRRGAELMAAALEILAPDSPRRATVLDFYADALIELGELEAAEAALAEAEALANRDGNRLQRGYAAWTRSSITAARDDAYATERLLREVERDAGDWFGTHIGVAFLTDAAVLLNALGLDAQADTYLDKARGRAGDTEETVRQARAMILARSGDPVQALDALQALVRGEWLDKRLTWRHTLLSAWATFRAGRDGSGELAARALEQAAERAGIATAIVRERELTLALAPLAELAGSQPARDLLLEGGRQFVIRLFGTPSVTDSAGNAIELPPGMPGELVRMLALHPDGLPTDVVLEAFFPDAPADAARQRLRQVLSRLRSSVGDELVTRDGESLRLAPAWVDVREFIAAADRVRAASGPRAVQRAYGALALWRDQLLPGDPYAEWAQEIRARADYRHLALLDMVAADAIRRRSHQEALTALEAAMRADPDDRDRPAKAAEQLRELGLGTAADYVAGPASPTSD
jgi:DNA-binding SARP family transcriptional activator